MYIKSTQYPPRLWHKIKDLETSATNLENLKLYYTVGRYDIIIEQLYQQQKNIEFPEIATLYLKATLKAQSKKALNFLILKTSKSNPAYQKIIEVKRLLKLTNYELWEDNSIWTILNYFLISNYIQGLFFLPNKFFVKFKNNFLSHNLNIFVKYFFLIRSGCIKILFNVLSFLLITNYHDKKLKILSVGKFPRLADIVDRLDPLLRENFRDETIYVVAPFNGYPNQKLKELYSNYFVFENCKSFLNRKMWNACLYFGIKANEIEVRGTDYRKLKQTMLTKKNIIKLDTKEEIQLNKELQSLKILDDRPFVALGLRDMAYYKKYAEIANVDYNKTSRTNTYHRSPNIKNYFDLLKILNADGYNVIRMGLAVSNKLDIEFKNLIVDYATTNRADKFDIYLLAKCDFVIAGDTGLFSGSAAFNKPALITDLFLIRNTVYSINKEMPNIFIPKLVLDLKTNTLLNFKETIYFNHHFANADACFKNGYKLINNKPDEILNGYLEMKLRLRNQYIESKEVKVLRKKFNDIFMPYQPGYQSTGEISEYFITKYQNLLI